jgi:signal transduction histidine kinase
LIVSDLTAFDQRSASTQKIAMLVLLVAVFAAYFLTARLLRMAIGPILHLSEIAARVSAERITSCALPCLVPMKSGAFMSFNGMLDGMLHRDFTLQNARVSHEIRTPLNGVIGMTILPSTQIFRPNNASIYRP